MVELKTLHTLAVMKSPESVFSTCLITTQTECTGFHPSSGTTWRSYTDLYWSSIFQFISNNKWWTISAQSYFSGLRSKIAQQPIISQYTSAAADYSSGRLHWSIWIIRTKQRSETFSNYCWTKWFLFFGLFLADSLMFEGFEGCAWICGLSAFCSWALCVFGFDYHSGGGRNTQTVILYYIPLISALCSSVYRVKNYVGPNVVNIFWKSSHKYDWTCV